MEKFLVLCCALALLFIVGCKSTAPKNAEPSPNGANSVPHTETARGWKVQAATIDPMDGRKTQLITTGDAGRQIVVCFEDGKLCHTNSPAVWVTSPCVVEPTPGIIAGHRNVRVKFDGVLQMEKRINRTFDSHAWAITDDHHAIFPQGLPVTFGPGAKSFIASLQKHKLMTIEYGCASYEREAVEFNIEGLQAAIESAGYSLELANNENGNAPKPRPHPSD